MIRETKVCDRCNRASPRLIELDDASMCPPCLLGAISDLVRDGLTRLDSIKVSAVRHFSNVRKIGGGK